MEDNPLQGSYDNNISASKYNTAIKLHKKTTVENTVEKSGYLKEKAELMKMDVFSSSGVTEERLIEGIKKIVGA